jgi:hypothetical protein
MFNLVLVLKDAAIGVQISVVAAAVVASSLALLLLEKFQC